MRLSCRDMDLMLVLASTVVLASGQSVGVFAHSVVLD